ncbi:hypothetical protein, partial [Mordavella massiliensis]|nr:hypothetical protein [Mordavella massiliensis]
MYNYKHDLITIINATTLDKQGIDAVQAAVNLLKHQAGYEKYFQQGPAAKDNNKNDFMPTNRQIANSVEQPVSQARAEDGQLINPRTVTTADLQWSADSQKPTDEDKGAVSDQLNGEKDLVNNQTATQTALSANNGKDS